MNIVTQLPAIQRHLREHPPEFMLQAAFVGYKPAVQAKSARALKRQEGSPVASARVLANVQRRPNQPWLPDELAAMDKLPPPNFGGNSF